MSLGVVGMLFWLMLGVRRGGATRTVGLGDINLGVAGETAKDGMIRFDELGWRSKLGRRGKGGEAG